MREISTITNGSIRNLLVYFFILSLTAADFSGNIFAQGGKTSVSVHFSVKVDTNKVRLYNQFPNDENDAVHTLVLKMKYGSPEILNPDAAKILTEVGVNIISVEVVYTDFHEHDVQNLLNKRRLTELYFLAPGLFTQSQIQWRYVQQMGYRTEEDAKKLLHGIVIKYLKVPVYQPPSLSSMLSEVKQARPKDTTFFSAFRKHIKFNQQLICVDMTGSMSPYYIQVLQWLSLKNDPNSLNFSFFNDGDEAADHLKRTGNVGGVYLFKTNSVDTIVKQAYTCIGRGSGGDAPENNIESIIKGVGRFPETKEIIMLVDNWADMRDYSLMHEVKLPVRIIVCGTDYQGIKSPVNPQYLDLARKTGGSIHTMEEDLNELIKTKEGDEIKFGGNRYIIRGGRFTRI